MWDNWLLGKQVCHSAILPGSHSAGLNACGLTVNMAVMVTARAGVRAAAGATVRGDARAAAGVAARNK